MKKKTAIFKSTSKERGVKEGRNDDDVHELP